VSEDGGRTWSPGANPADDGSTSGHGYADLAADRRGRFHLVWLDGRGGRQGLRAASSDDGRRWSANRTLDDATCECCPNRLAMAGDGTAYVLYRDTEPRDMAVASTTDGGQSWTRRGTAGAFGWRFEGCPHVGGGLSVGGMGNVRTLSALLWTGQDDAAGVHVLTSADGVAWQQTGFEPRARGRHGDLAASGEALAAVWDERQEGTTVVLRSLSTDGGRTWTPPLRLSSAGVRASHPLVVPTGPGRFLAGWTEAAGTGPLAWRTAVLAMDPG
jgi:hypothetical protein